MKTLLTIILLLAASASFSQKKIVKKSAKGSVHVMEKSVAVTVTSYMTADTLVIENTDNVRFVTIGGRKYMLLADDLKAVNPSPFMDKWMRQGNGILWTRKTKKK